jgi:putative DNA primase/helicase
MGYWLTSDCPYWFLDLDHAAGDDGQWLPFAQQLCRAYPGAMVEASSSGTGLHVIGMGQVPPHRNKPSQDTAAQLAPLALEFYSAGRGVAFGLDGHAQGCADTAFDVAPLVAAYFQPTATSAHDDSAPCGGFKGTDDELIDRALNARESAAVAFGGRASFADLWHGRADKNSENDAALIARLLWWTGGEVERVERLALRSGMVRNKWNERRPGGTYLTHTVAEISAKVDSYYQEPATTGDEGTASATSDLANARRLVNAHGQDLMHVPGVGWHVWAGDGPWQCDDGHAQRLAFGLGRMIQIEADALTAWVDDEKVAGSDEQKRRADYQKTLHRWARSSEFVVSVRHTLDAAQTMLSVKADQLDASPMLVGTPGGVIDLATGGTQREHRRDDRITKRIACDYDPAAKASTWIAFISRIMGGDAELIAYLQTLCGYMLCGERGEHALPVLYGKGANGKSTFLATIQSLLADYAGTAAPGLLLARRDSDQLAAIAGLRGLRLVVVSESGETERLDESRVKQITGGDRLTGRPLYQNFVEFTPTHLALLQTNHRPRINGTDDGIWRRLKLIPFAVTIPERERDPTLTQKLRAEFAGILAWMVEGWQMYKRHGFQEPKAVRIATAEYRSASDQVGQFISERCVEGPEHTSTAGAIYAAYRQWCAEHGENPMTQRALGLKLAERAGIEQGRSMSARTWRGLAIASCAELGHVGGQVVPLARKG